MKILHVTAGAGPASGGLGTSVPSLARALALHGHETGIATLAQDRQSLSQMTLMAVDEGVSLQLFKPSVPASGAFSWDMLRHLGDLIERYDIVHVHSAWTFPVYWAARQAHKRNKVLVFSPRGVLDPLRLSHSAWKKRIASNLFNRRILQRAGLLHATSKDEVQWIEQYLAMERKQRPPMAWIPNGFGLPPEARQIADGDPDCSLPKNSRLALYIGRLHPLKGLDLLLEAWAQWKRESSPKTLAEGVSRWKLVLAGPDEQGTLRGLLRQADKLKLTCRCFDRSGTDVVSWAQQSCGADVSFTGIVDGMDKWQLYRAAELFLLPTRSENFGMTVAEAACMKKPVITTHGAPWRGLEEHAAGWWVPVSVGGLRDALRLATAMPSAELSDMGRRGKRWVEQTFGWESLADRWIDVYRWTLGLSDMPKDVL